MSVMNLLRTDDFLMLNRHFIRILGLNCAIILCELINQHHYFEDKRLLQTFDDGEYFYEKIDDMEYKTGLSRKEQDRAIKSLKEKGLIKTAIKGMPAKRFFLICEDQVALLFSKENYSLSRRDKQECLPGTTQFDPQGQTAQYIYKEKEEEKRTNQTREKIGGLAGSKSFFFTNAKGEKTAFDESLVFRHLLKFNHSTELIKQAISESMQMNGPVNNYLKLIESICEKLSNKNNINKNESKVPERPKYTGKISVGIKINERKK